jgi:antitoxin YefM
MDTVPADEARDLLVKLLDQVAESHEPVLITGERAKAVLVAEDDWRAVQETLHVLSSPDVRDSILEGMATPVEACDDECGFW